MINPMYAPVVYCPEKITVQRTINFNFFPVLPQSEKKILDNFLSRIVISDKALCISNQGNIGGSEK